ncbi:MAG: Gfo/Idh/MocA family protein [Candidatus Bathyarchaeales archaeon]
MMKVGILGCGGIAPVHLGVYKSLKDMEVTSLCDLNIEKAKNLAAKFRVKKIYNNYWDMFDKENLDLVDICTPVSTHAQIACDAAKVIPAILLEKPMALTTAECDNIIKEVKKHGSKLCVGHSQIFSPHIIKAKSMVDSGLFNLYCFSTLQKESFEILHRYNLAPTWNVSPEQRGIIWEVCCHLAYLQLHFLPDIKEVYAVGSKVKYPVYDDFAVLFRTSGQRFGIIELSWLSQETETIYELRDVKGRRVQIHWEFDYSLEKSEEPPFTVSKVVKNFLTDEKRILQKWLRFAICYFRKRKLLPTFNLISSYIEAIRKDLPPPVPPEEGKNTIKLLECIEESLDEKRPVKMNS